MKKKSEKNLTVDFYEVDAGWIYFKLTVGRQIFDNYFSEVFDPLPDLKHWLEAISIGVQQTSFQYNNEGLDIVFDFERVSWDKEVLTISEAGFNRPDFLKANVDRRQIVKAFYFGLLDFANSDKFDSKEWEIEFLKERLCKILNIDEQTLIDRLTNLDKKELGKTLFDADPRYLITSETSEEKVEQDIPDEYDLWTADQKRAFVIECIATETAGYDGMKISDFRSPIIEKYINEA